MQNVMYSQNFLRSRELVNKLLDISNFTKDDIVYEIGAGKGIITDELAKRCRKVIAFEIDHTFYHQLQSKYEDYEKVELHKGDFLTAPLPQATYKVFSNIPFNITADIIRKLTHTRVPPVDSYLVIQKEAALKFLGFPTGQETQASLSLRPWFDLQVRYHFRSTDFSPIPHVAIVLLQLRKREQPLIDENNAQLYKDFIAYAFSRWKPTLAEGLKEVLTKVQVFRLAKDLGFSEAATQTNLHFSQWLGLFRYFLTGVEARKKEYVKGMEKRQKNQQRKLAKIHRTRLGEDWKTKAA